MNKNYYDFDAHEFLSMPSVANELDQDTLTKLGNREVRLEDAVFFATADVSGQGGTTELITNSTAKKKGTVNFDKSTLPKLENLVLKSIQFGYAAVDEGDDVAKAVFSSVIPADMDPAVLKATLVIRQEDKIVFERPVRDLMAESEEDPKIYNLTNWRLIKGDRLLEIKLEYPEGLSVAASGSTLDTHYVEVRLIGTKTRVK